MIVKWDSRLARLETYGKHKKGTPRIWIISVQAYKAIPGKEELDKLTMLVRPKGKVQLTCLDSIVRAELRDYQPDFVLFQAVAR